MIKRKYLTFDELVERWGCERKDIHYLISEGDLAPSIAWDGRAMSYQWEPESGNPEHSVLCRYRDENGCSEIVFLRGWVYLHRPAIYGPFENYRFVFASHDRNPKTTEFCPGALYRLGGDEDYAQVTGFDIEKNAVFMEDEIAGCEIISCPSIGFAMDKRKQGDGKKSPSSKEFSAVPVITGATFDRLQRAMAAFPVRYPEYQSKPPKLDDDVRPWLKESGLTENDAERRVFGAIIREHFKLASDMLKM